MKYRAVSELLHESRSKSEIANFFLAPVQHPEIVMQVLLEKQKHKKPDESPVVSKPENPRKMIKTPAPPRPHPVPRSAYATLGGFRSPRQIFFRGLAIVSMAMFLSCAVGPNMGILVNVKQGVQYEDPSDEYIEVEPITKFFKSAWYTAGNLLTGSELPENLVNSFSARFLKGQWAGVALLDKGGQMTALARPDSYDTVADWVLHYRELEDENRMLRDSLEALHRAQESKKIYLELNLDDNLLFVKMGTQILYKFSIVSGKGYTPRTSKWRRGFATPRGMLTVKKKEKWPVWYPPAWHWSERGVEVPEVRGAIRGVLGKYRLNLGHSYGIHGTASGRIRPGKYSHGCIRMNNKDLEIVYKLTDEGTEVYIY